MSQTPPNTIRQGGNAYAVREAAKRFARVIEELVPESGAKGIALKNLDQATEWACEAIAFEVADV